MFQPKTFQHQTSEKRISAAGVDLHNDAFRWGKKNKQVQRTVLHCTRYMGEAVVLSNQHTHDIWEVLRRRETNTHTKKDKITAPVLVAVVGASSRDGAELLAIATEGLRGELVLWSSAQERSFKTRPQNSGLVGSLWSRIKIIIFYLKVFKLNKSLIRILYRPLATQLFKDCH